MIFLILLHVFYRPYTDYVLITMKNNRTDNNSDIYETSLF